MKRCPECRRDYYDDTLLYCLNDGTELVYGLLPDEPATAILHETAPPSEAATRAQIHTTEQTGVFPNPTEPMAKKGVSRKASIIAGVIGVLLVTALGIGSYWLYGRGGTKQIDSIAVMPFVNANGNADVEYLSDGITESLINNLSQLSKLSVKASSSVFRYKGKDIEPQQAAADLKVQAVLNGRVNQHGDSLTISLDLVDGVTGNQIWGEQYTRKMGDLATMQSEIARDVSQKLRTRLTGAEENRVVKNQTQNAEAYQLYLQGRYNWNKRTDQAVAKAIEYFQQAIEKDPNYAMAYVGQAESYLLSDKPADERFPKVKASALKALEIDPTLGEPHAAIAVYKVLYERDFGGAEQEYTRAIELSPNYATAYHWYAEFVVQKGRFDESLPFWKKALELDPFSLAIGTDYALEYLYYSRQYDAAVDYLNKLVEMDPNYVRTHDYLGQVYVTMGRYEDALNEFEKRNVLQGNKTEDIARGKQELLDALKTKGPKGYWSKILEFTMKENKNEKDLPAIDLAHIYSELGERDEAFKWLEKAYENKDADLAWMKVSPTWDKLRDDPRFAEIVKKIGLPS